MLDVLNVSTGRNSATDDKFPNRVLTGTYDTGFHTRLMAKDVRLFNSVAAEVGTAARGQRRRRDRCGTPASKRCPAATSARSGSSSLAERGVSAATASRRVESSIGSRLTSGVTSNGISVHASAIGVGAPARQFLDDLDVASAATSAGSRRRPTRRR